MNRMYLIAKLALTVLGICLLIWLLDSLRFSVLSSIRIQLDDESGSRDRILLVFFACAIPFSIVYCLLFYNDGLAKWMSRSKQINDSSVDYLWIVTVYRVTLFLCGTLFLFNSVHFLLRAIIFTIYCPKIIVDMIIYNYVDSVFRMPVDEWIGLFFKLCRAALVIYLILGAPYLVCRQLKSLAVDSKPEDLEASTQ